MNELERRLVEICEDYLNERDSKNKHLKIDEDFENSLVTINCFEDTEFYGHQIHPKILGSISIRKGQDYFFNESLDENFENYVVKQINLMKGFEYLTD